MKHKIVKRNSGRNYQKSRKAPAKVFIVDFKDSGISEDKLNKVLNYEDIQSRQIQFNIDYNNRF